MKLGSSSDANYHRMGRAGQRGSRGSPVDSLPLFRLDCNILGKERCFRLSLSLVVVLALGSA